jgi:hypothetical protein
MTRDTTESNTKASHTLQERIDQTPRKNQIGWQNPPKPPANCVMLSRSGGDFQQGLAFGSKIYRGGAGIPFKSLSETPH